MTNKINLETLEQVTGGKKNVVHNPHKGYAYVNCRKSPGLDSKIICRISNGTHVNPTGNTARNNGFTWYEIRINGNRGWVAGHLIGR